MEKDSEEEAHEHVLAKESRMKKSEEKINSRAFTLYALGTTEGCSSKAVKKFKSLAYVSMEQRRKDASEPLHLYRYE
jgi:hypothetical protein